MISIPDDNEHLGQSLGRRPSLGAFAVCLALMPHATFAQDGPTVVTRTWVCERGVAVPVTTVMGEGGSVAVLNVENAQMTLMGEVSEQGQRYGWPSGGSSYVWWEDGETARLFWKDGTTGGTETVLLNACTPRP